MFCQKTTQAAFQFSVTVLLISLVQLHVAFKHTRKGIKTPLYEHTKHLTMKQSINLWVIFTRNLSFHSIQSFIELFSDVDNNVHTQAFSDYFFLV